jgi:hypothetical protein
MLGMIDADVFEACQFSQSPSVANVRCLPLGFELFCNFSVV